MAESRTCPSCAGEREGPACGGTGWRYRVFNARAIREICGHCNGVGVCATCGGLGLIRRIMAEGAEFNITPYGTEALGVMRIEKGHATANELNGTTTAQNLGMGRMVSTKKDSIGAVLSRREGLNQANDLRQVGIKPIDPSDMVPAGAHLMNADGPVDAVHDQGYATSACYSPNLGHHIALGFLKDGTNRMGEQMPLVSPLTGVDVKVEICSAHFVDPEGERLRA